MVQGITWPVQLMPSVNLATHWLQSAHAHIGLFIYGAATFLHEHFPYQNTATKSSTQQCSSSPLCKGRGELCNITSVHTDPEYTSIISTHRSWMMNTLSHPSPPYTPCPCLWIHPVVWIYPKFFNETACHLTVTGKGSPVQHGIIVIVFITDPCPKRRGQEFDDFPMPTLCSQVQGIEAILYQVNKTHKSPKDVKLHWGVLPCGVVRSSQCTHICMYVTQDCNVQTNMEWES